MTKTRIAVFVSGGGTNLQSIIDSIQSGQLNVEVALVLSSRKQAYALKRAQAAGINTLVCSPHQYSDNYAYTQYIIALLESYQIDLVVLAGFMTILDTAFIKRYQNRIMNTHPSLLPSFGGKGCYGNRVHQKVLDYGVKVSGASIMFVSEQVDQGPIILQQCVAVAEDDTVETLREKVLAVEHKLYPQAIQLFAQGRLQVEGRRVRILKKEVQRND